MMESVSYNCQLQSRGSRRRVERGERGSNIGSACNFNELQFSLSPIWLWNWACEFDLYKQICIDLCAKSRWPLSANALQTERQRERERGGGRGRVGSLF